MVEAFKNFLKTNNQELEEIKRYFQKCADDIDRSNLYMLRRSCMYTSIVFVCMLLFGVSLIPGFNVTMGHYLMIPLLLSFYVINSFVQKKDEVSTLTVAVLCLLFYFGVGLCFILMEVHSNLTNHTRWLPLLMMCFPVLFIDRMYKYVLEELFLTLVYGVISFHFKDPVMFSRDVYTVVAALILSVLTARIILGVRSRQGLAMNELKRISSMDKLTHVYNKTALLDEIDNALLKKDSNIPCAMCIIDVDNFKVVNDSLGHNRGDILLEHIGKLLLSNFRPTDIIGRFGGDEFVVFMPGMKDPNLVELRCRSAQMLLTDFTIGNNEPFSLSIGTIIDNGGHNRESLFEMADDALYVSKMAGKNKCTSWIIEKTQQLSKPLLVFAPVVGGGSASILPEEEEERFTVFSVKSEEEGIRYISQYAMYIRMVVAEVDTGSGKGTLLIRYLRDRERFADIPILAVTDSEENKAAVRKMGVEKVLAFTDPPDLFKETISEMGGK
ncbi:MAG: GGDEF domain-containing protein [Butyrivibrio sp.]|nr:GGDEF domain-containing protein [Butyrivibrio sp.]